MRPRIFLILTLWLLAARSACARAEVTRTGGQADFGIYGQMVGAWGNPPSSPAHYQCIKVLDALERNTIALGACSGTFAKFRVPLAPGSLCSRIRRPLGVHRRKSPIRPRSSPHHGVRTAMAQPLSGRAAKPGAISLRLVDDSGQREQSSAGNLPRGNREIGWRGHFVLSKP